MNLTEILDHSTYKLLPDLYSIAKINSDFEISDAFMISQDDAEVTAIYKEGVVFGGVIEEKKHYRLIAVNVAIPFYSPGFIATITQALAAKSISVLVVSTYSRDYFIVSSKDICQAIDEIRKLGIKEQ